MAKLTAKQEKFVQEYLVDLNATAAYKRAGYKAQGNAAEVNASKLLRNTKVAKTIAEAQAKRAEKIEINQEYVLNRLVQIDQMDALDILNDDGSVKPVKDWPKVWRQFLSGYDIVQINAGEGIDALIKKIKWPDKIKNLELIGRHLGMFNDKLTVDVTDKLADAILAGRKRTNG